MSTLLFALSFLAGGGQPKSRMDLALAGLERDHGVASLVVLAADTGHVRYVFNTNLAGVRFPIGSLIKPFVALTLLEDPAFDPDRTVPCFGRFLLPATLIPSEIDKRRYNLPYDASAGSYYVKDWLAAGHGPVSLEKALALSCNTYFLHMGQRADRLLSQAVTERWHLTDSTQRSTEFWTVSEIDRLMNTIGEGGPRLTLMEVAQLYTNLWNELEPGAGRNGMVRQNVGQRLRIALARTLRDGTLAGLVERVRHPRITLLGGKTGTATQAGARYKSHGWAVVYLRWKGMTLVAAAFVVRGTSRTAQSLVAVYTNLIGD